MSNRENPFSEFWVSKKAYYLPTENTYEGSKIGYFIWRIDEEKPPS